MNSKMLLILLLLDQTLAESYLREVSPPLEDDVAVPNDNPS